MSSGWLSRNRYLIRMSYDNVIMSSGWHRLPFVSHPDEIVNFDFPHHAVALQRFRTFAPKEFHHTLWCRQACQPCGVDEACCSFHWPLITIWLGDLHICTQTAFPYPCLKFGSECMLIQGIMPGWQLWGVPPPPQPPPPLLAVKLWITTLAMFEFCVRYSWQAKRLRNGNTLFQTPQD